MTSGLSDSLEDLRLEVLYEALLLDVSPEVRKEAALALGYIGNPKAISSLCQAFRQDSVDEVRVCVIKALSQISRLPSSVTLSQLVIFMHEAAKYDLRGATIGNFADVVEGNQITTQHNYTDAVNLTAAEIQELLLQLGQLTPNIAPETQQSVVQAVDIEIKKDPTFRERLSLALLAGGSELVKVLLPLAGIPIEMVKAWRNSD